MSQGRETGLDFLPGSIFEEVKKMPGGKKRKNKGTRCSCCRPGRFVDVAQFVFGLKFYHSDDGTPAEVIY